ncbi:MAG: tRNA lysidine(34) synthetase TilS [Chthoniobacteraceae bacterium]
MQQPSRKPFARIAVPEGFDRDEPQLVGVSGGRDSIALLHWMHANGFRKTIACHLDHRLRPESDDDAAFVRQFAADLGLDCVLGSADVRALAKHGKLSIETAARESRYDFFARTAHGRNCRRLFLAHHADDQVETFLHNLLRGAGPGGLGGMGAVSTREIPGEELIVARPLLEIWRDEIDAYIAAHRLPFREDASNADPAFTRNRLRHSVLPGLSKAMGRDVRPVLLRTAEMLRAEDEFLAAQPELRGAPDALPVATLRSLPLALQRRLILTWLRRHGVASCGFAEVEGVRSLLGTRPAKINLPGGLCARRREKRIFIAPQ